MKKRKQYYIKKGYRCWCKGQKLSQEMREKMRETAKENNENRKASGKLGALKRWLGHIKIVKSKGTRTRGISKDPLMQLQKKRFRNQRYKAKKRANGGSHIFSEWLELKTFYQNICLCCKKQEPEIKLTEDHIMPLYMGGNDNIENIQPLCQSCNTRKHTKYIDYRIKKREGVKI